MRINWKRLLKTIGIIVISSSLLGFLTWFGMNKIIQEKDAEINLLTNTSKDLSQLYLKKLADKKAKEEAQAATQTYSQTTQETKDDTRTSQQSQIYYFYDPSCGTCMAQKPIVLELQSEGVPFVFFDIVAHPNYVSKYNITAVPTFILNGHKRAAFFSKPQLRSFWNTYK